MEVSGLEWDRWWRWYCRAGENKNIDPDGQASRDLSFGST